MTERARMLTILKLASFYRKWGIIMGKYFGTDGVRGVAGADLTCELAMKIGRGAAAVLTGSTGHRPRILIGKDTRQSGDMLEAALTAGLCSVGADVESLGVLPTPAVAYLVGKYNADAGIVISASHNPMEFNGIKIFAGTGYKLPDEVENQIEVYIDNDCAGIELKTGAEVGRVYRRDDGLQDYVDHLYESIHGDLTGLNICIDCANGASAAVAQKLFPRLGAKCTFLGIAPDGENINKGVGSTHLENLEKAVVEGGFDCGIAFDGDADRCLAVDENGSVVNGDKILYVCGKFLKSQGKLNGNTVVTTVMSNMGLYKAFEAEGINYEQTAVGDKYVAENMLENNYSIGGEQSGHVIFSRYAATGDGILTSLMIMEACVEQKATLCDLAKEMKVYPQILRNVRVADKKTARENPKVVEAVEAAARALSTDGRILVRESGTEPLIRVMVEAGTEEICAEHVNNVVRVMEEEGLVVE